MCKFFLKKKINNDNGSTEEYDVSQIIEMAKLIIDRVEKRKENAYSGYSERNGRHPIYGYINFVVRKYVYDIAFNDISKNGCHGLMGFNPSNFNSWLLDFKPKENDPITAIYLNDATDPIISSYDNRCSIESSFAELGYVSKVDLDFYTNFVLLKPFGVGLILDGGCHSALSLNMRGEYKARINHIYDFSGVVKEWEYKDGLLVKDTTKEKRKAGEGISDSLFQLTAILFSIGKVMVEHGIEWREYSSLDDN